MSKSFTFSLQKIFDFRKNIENKRAVELGHAQTALKKKKDKLILLQDKKEKSMEHAESQIKNTVKIDLAQLKIQKDYIVQLSENIKNQSEQVCKSGKVVEKNREKLLNASKDKKVLEKLKSKYFDDYKKMKNLEDKKKEDEVSSRLALNKRKTELT